MSIQKGIDMKLNIKPIFGAMVHEYAFEGPCRFGVGEQLSAEYDRMAAGIAFKKFKEELEAQLSGSEFRLLEPLYGERDEQFIVHADDIEKMRADDLEADCYLVASVGRTYDQILALAEKTRKPILSVQFCCNNTIVSAMLRARGFEAYTFPTWEETVRQLRILRVRKVFQKSNVMLVTRGNSVMAPISASDGFLSLEEVTRRLGVHFRYLDLHEYLDQATGNDPDGNYTLPTRRGLNLTADEREEVSRRADELIANAEECTVKKQYIENSLRAYMLSKKAMEHMECNAMTIPCPEACATTRLNKEQFTFCLNHALLCEEGIPSACEYDIPGLLAMIALSNFSASAPYLGNTISVPLKEDNRTLYHNFIWMPKLGEAVAEIEDEEARRNLILTLHSVPNRKMRGFNEPDAPYRIHPFTGSGWGPTLRHDFRLDAGQIITMARFSPAADALFVARGVVRSSVGEDLNGCTSGVVFSVKDRHDFHEKQVSFGNHIPLVYGDCLEEMVEFGRQLGLKVVTA